MSSSREKILELVATGQLTPAEADTMLAGMKPRVPALWERLSNPLVWKLSHVLVLSALVAVAALALSALDLRFVGVLGAKRALEPVGWLPALVGILMGWPVAALLFWGMARVFGQRGARYVDMLALVGVGRLPIVLTGLCALAIPLPQTRDVAALQAAYATPSVLAWAGLMMALILWAVVMLLLGYRTASGLRGPKWIASFLSALVVCEVAANVVAVWLR